MDGLLDIFLPRLINFLITISIILLALTFCSKKRGKLQQKTTEKPIRSPTVVPTVVKDSKKEKSKKSVKKSQKSKKKCKSTKKMKSEKGKKEKSVKKSKEEKSKDNKKKKKMEKSGDLRIMTTQQSTPVSMNDGGDIETDSIGTAQIEMVNQAPSRVSKERVGSREPDKKPKRDKDRLEASPGTGGTGGTTKMLTAAEMRTRTAQEYKTIM